MKLLTIDTQRNCYVIDPNGMNNLQQNVASSITLEKGNFELKISSGLYSYDGSKTDGEPLVILWIYGVDGSTFINKNTGTETGATWTTLNGYHDKLQLEVKNRAVICALFFDVYARDNKGQVKVSISSDNTSFTPQEITVDSQKNCYLLDEKILSSVKQASNFVELEPGNYNLKIRESNATYWSSEQKFQLEPWALLWIKNGKFVSNLTGIEVEETWCSLNGLQDEFTLEVKEKTAILGFFFDTVKEDNKGQVVLEVNAVTQAEVNEKYKEKESAGKTTTDTKIEGSKVTVLTSGGGTSSEVTGSSISGVGAGIKTGGSGFSFSIDEEQMERMWQDMAARIETSVSVGDDKDENKQAYWDSLEKSILKGYQSQAKKLAMQVARLEFMVKVLTQQMEESFNQSFQGWSAYFNKTVSDLFVTRIPRIVSEQVHLRIDEQTQEVKNLVIQQMQAELNSRVESVVNLKINSLTQEIKTSVVQQMQTELEQRIENVVNVKIANQSQQINTQVINQMSSDIDQRIESAVNVKIANQSQDITNRVINQIQLDIDQRVENVVELKISDRTQDIKNLILQEMQNYIEDRIDNTVNLKISKQASEISTQVVHLIQSNIDKRIDSVVNLKIANQNQTIKNLVVNQIESDFEQRIKSFINQTTNDNVQVVVNNVVKDLDNRINVNLDNKILNFRNDVTAIVNNQINQNFADSLKTTLLADIKNQQFYIDMQSIKAEVENFYARLGQFESQLYIRIEQGDTQLYNWTLEQLLALQGCLTDRQALVEMFELFARNLKDELNGAECVHPSRFTAWVRKTSQPQFSPSQSQQLLGE